jgi:hypothetical protein
MEKGMWVKKENTGQVVWICLIDLAGMKWESMSWAVHGDLEADPEISEQKSCDGSTLQSTNLNY